MKTILTSLIFCVTLFLATSAAALASQSTGYVGEPKGILTLGAGFGMVMMRGRLVRLFARRSGNCEVIDIRKMLQARQAEADARKAA